jgi:hypothetical protein
MKSLSIKAVILSDKEGNYVVHGSNVESTEEMFKAMQPIWHFDPSKEVAHVIEFSAEVPELADVKIGPLAENDGNAS